MDTTSEHRAAMVESATIARLHYIEGMSKSEIGRHLSQSRFRIARILDEAIDKGHVKIEINYPVGKIDTDLSSKLRTHLGLEHCLVIPNTVDTTSLLCGLGEVTADLLSEISTPSDVLGLSWARALEAMMPLVKELSVAATIQLGGAYPSAGSEPTALDLVREIGRRSSGETYTFYAPMIATDGAAAAAIRRQLDVEAAMRRYKDVTIALLGIGAWDPELSTVAKAIHSESSRAFEEIRDSGVIGDIGGITFSATGEFVRSSVSERSITINAENLRAIPRVVGVAFDGRKANAVRATVEGGFLTGLVTHAELADELLRLSPVTPPGK